MDFDSALGVAMAIESFETRSFFLLTHTRNAIIA